MSSPKDQLNPLYDLAAAEQRIEQLRDVFEKHGVPRGAVKLAYHVVIPDEIDLQNDHEMVYRAAYDQLHLTDDPDSGSNYSFPINLLEEHYLDLFPKAIEENEKIDKEVKAAKAAIEAGQKTLERHDDWIEFTFD